MISAIISCMNRTDRLIPMLPTWTEVDKIKDIVVLDWSSREPISENKEIQKILKNSNKIKIVRVDGQKHFHLGKSNNLAYTFTDPKNKILLKLDVDYMNINSKWIDSLVYINGYLKKYFIVGSYKFYKSSNGFLLVNKPEFAKVKGYNENLLSAWGWDDVDLHKRLSDLFSHDPSHRKIEFFNIKDYIYHIPHDDDLRLENYPIKIKSDLLNKSEADKDKNKNWVFKKVKVLESRESYQRIILED